MINRKENHLNVVWLMPDEGSHHRLRYQTEHLGLTSKIQINANYSSLNAVCKFGVSKTSLKTTQKLNLHDWFGVTVFVLGLQFR